jgi:hypothetical protein
MSKFVNRTQTREGIKVTAKRRRKSVKAKRALDKQVRLKKDIVIPAGTIMGPAPLNVGRCVGHFEHLIAMGKDNTASLVVFLERDAETAEWLEPVNFER